MSEPKDIRLSLLFGCLYHRNSTEHPLSCFNHVYWKPL